MKTINEDTILLGCVPDQAELHGLLTKTRGLGLMILLVEKIVQETNDELQSL